MQGWSARGQSFWWQGWQGTRWRRISEWRDQGRHWPGWLVPLKRMTESVPAEAARWAGPESAPMNRSARSSSAVVWVTVSRPVQSRSRSWPGQHLGRRRVFRAAHDDDPPAVLEEPLDQACSSAAGPPLGRGAGPEVDGQEGRQRAEPAGVEPVGIAGGARDAVGARRRRWSPAIVGATPGDDGGRRLDPAGLPAGPGLGEPAADRRRGRRRRRARATRARLVGGDPQRLQQRQPRADLVPAADPVGDVGQQEPAPAHRPADPPRDAPQGQHQHGQSTSPRTSMPRS